MNFQRVQTYIELTKGGVEDSLAINGAGIKKNTQYSNQIKHSEGRTSPHLS